MDMPVTHISDSLSNIYYEMVGIVCLRIGNLRSGRVQITSVYAEFKAHILASGVPPRMCLLPALPSDLCHPQVTGSLHPSLLTHNQGRAFKTDSMGPSCLEKQTQALVRLCSLGRLSEWLEGSRQLFTSCLLNHYFGAF